MAHCSTFIFRTHAMRHSSSCLVLAAVLALPLSLAGCTPVGVAVGAGATVGSVALEERGFEQGVKDRVTEAAISKSLFDYNLDAFADVGVEVVEGRVLLTGRVDKPEHRVEAVRFAWQEEEVVEVINEIRVGTSDDALADRGKDAWIATQLRTKITLDSQVKAVNYSAEVVDGTIYLFGIAQNESELKRVVAHARTIENVRRIVPDYVRMKDDPSRAG
ncbi:BON domain-containing protein [Hwanghaeella grinnelliae]|uniref:BON domain-containing protein n=2 Tax=Hwanghaeella grinnelliae TaxID=2500179 RepID=A0A3S2VQ11_9PROT|nr:BON domain-containing protein [Hwanghaeella grinnelliae]